MTAAARSHSPRAGDGRSMLDVGHVVELRCGREQRAGVWFDAWRQCGAYSRAELANQAAEGLRGVGHTVRVRPVIR